MINLKMICVGKMKERFYIEACGEYSKRLSAYCRLEICELQESKLPDSPSGAQTAAALEKEAAAILSEIPKGAAVIAMCVEGEKKSSEEFSAAIRSLAEKGASKLCFIVGGSNGLSDEVKRSADIRLSVSDMTFPHHLFRVMLLEQIYRAFKILNNEKYHK